MVACFDEFHAPERVRILLVRIVVNDDRPVTGLRPAALSGREDPVLVVDIDAVVVHVIGIQAVVARSIHQGPVSGAGLGIGLLQTETQGVVVLVGRHVAGAPVPPFVHDRGTHDRVVPAAHDDEGARRGAAVQETTNLGKGVRSFQRILELGVTYRVRACFTVVGRHGEGSLSGTEIQRAAGGDAGLRAVLAVRELEIQGFHFHGGHVQSAGDEVHDNGALPVVAPVVGDDGGADLGLQAEVDRRTLTEPGVHQGFRVAGRLGAGKHGDKGGCPDDESVDECIHIVRL